MRAKSRRRPAGGHWECRADRSEAPSPVPCVRAGRHLRACEKWPRPQCQSPHGRSTRLRLSRCESDRTEVSPSQILLWSGFQGRDRCHETGAVTPGELGPIVRSALEYRNRRVFVPTPAPQLAARLQAAQRRERINSRIHSRFRLREATHPRPGEDVGADRFNAGVHAGFGPWTRKAGAHRADALAGWPCPPHARGYPLFNVPQGFDIQFLFEKQWLILSSGGNRFLIEH